MIPHTHRALYVLCLWTMLVPAGPAQQDAVAPADAAVSALGRTHSVFRDDRVLGAIGPGYKAVFDRGGMELTPALGSRAPQSLPLRFTLESIRRGSRVVYEVDEHPEPEHLDGVVVYSRGPDIRERYETRADGVELSFVFERPLPGEGDLVVRGRITSDLDPVEDGAAGLRFLRPGLGGVAIGAVTGIDAVGARTNGTLRLVGRHLELSLPADFVRRAVHPLVLDPIVGPQFAASPGTDDDSDPDAAYDQTHGVYLVVWRRSFSATDSVIVAQRIDRFGVLAGTPMLLTNSGFSANPTVANVDAQDRFLVVWQSGPWLLGPFDIRCRYVDAGTGAASNVVTIAGTTASETHPDAAGDNAGGDAALVVWEDAALGILGQPVRVSGVVPAPIGQPTVIGSSAIEQRTPAISRSHSSTAPHVVVWSDGVVGLRAQAVDRTMALMGSSLFWSQSFPPTRLRAGPPDVDGDGMNYMVVYALTETQLSQQHDIFCYTLRWNGSALVQGPGGLVEAEPGDDEIDPTVAWIGNKFVVLWSDANGGLDYHIEGAELDGSCRPCGPRFTLTGLNNPATRRYESAPRIATQRAAGVPNTDVSLIVFGEADVLPPFTSGIVAQRHRGLGDSPFVDLSPGCGNGGTTHSISQFAIGSSTFRFALVNAVPGSLAFLSLSLGDPPVACGPCTIANPSTFQFKGVVPASGTVVSPFPVPCSFLPYVGAPLEFQWVTLVTGANPCPLVPDLSTTNRRRVTLVY